MYRIHKEKNRIERLENPSFVELGFKERDNLQEWIANDPQVFGEELLIIQKEFSGFSETNERLDLLALDKQGDLVIIENKLDDTGRDVCWQCLKYASYCSSLSKENIRKIYQDYLDKTVPNLSAEEKLSEFYENSDYEEISINMGLTQRLILVAAKFRKEVTSTVLWLLNYKLRIQCFKVSPYSMGDQLFVNFEQIIPTKDAEDYMIGMAEKTQDDLDSLKGLKSRHIIRREFWLKMIQEINQKSNLFQNISPSKYNWISAGSGVRGIGFNLAVSKAYGRAELYIDRGNKDQNQDIFDKLFSQKDTIEQEFVGNLVWERLEDKRACRIKAETPSNVFEKENWPEMIEFMCDSMLQLEKVFKKPIKKIGASLKLTV